MISTTPNDTKRIVIGERSRGTHPLIVIPVFVLVSALLVYTSYLLASIGLPEYGAAVLIAIPLVAWVFDLPLLLSKPLTQAELDTLMAEVSSEVRERMILERGDALDEGGFLVITLHRADLLWRVHAHGSIDTPNSTQWIGVSPYVRSALARRASRRRLAATTIWSEGDSHSCQLAPPTAHDKIASLRDLAQFQDGASA